MADNAVPPGEPLPRAAAASSVPIPIPIPIPVPIPMPMSRAERMDDDSPSSRPEFAPASELVRKASILSGGLALGGLPGGMMGAPAASALPMSPSSAGIMMSSAMSTTTSSTTTISDTPGQGLCTYSKGPCGMRRIDGFLFCVRHMTEDPTYVPRKCEHVDASSQMSCMYIVTPGEPTNFCDLHRPRNDKGKGKRPAGMAAVTTAAANSAASASATSATAPASVAASSAPQTEDGKKKKAEKRPNPDPNQGVSLATRRKRLRKFLSSHAIPVRSEKVAACIGPAPQKSEALDAAGNAFPSTSKSSIPSSSEDEFTYEIQKDLPEDEGTVAQDSKAWLEEWKDGASESDDGSEGEAGDPFHAGCFATPEEVLLRRKARLVNLQQLYRQQFFRLKHVLNAKHQAYLATRKDTEAQIETIEANMRPFFPEEVRVAQHRRRLCEPAPAVIDGADVSSSAQHHYKSTGGDRAALRVQRMRIIEANLARQMQVPSYAMKLKCSYQPSYLPPCPHRALVFSRFCFRHILKDPAQLLYKRCEYKDELDTPCETPILCCEAPPYCEEHLKLNQFFHNPRLSDGTHVTAADAHAKDTDGTRTQAMSEGSGDEESARDEASSHRGREDSDGEDGHSAHHDNQDHHLHQQQGAARSSPALSSSAASHRSRPEGDGDDHEKGEDGVVGGGDDKAFGVLGGELDEDLKALLGPSTGSHTMASGSGSSVQPSSIEDITRALLAHGDMDDIGLELDTGMEDGTQALASLNVLASATHDTAHLWNAAALGAPDHVLQAVHQQEQGQQQQGTQDVQQQGQEGARQE